MENIIYLVFRLLLQFRMIYSTSDHIISTYIDVQPYGTRFVPINQVELISTSYNVKSLTFCGALCSRNSLCRTFDYNSDRQCRLFDGDINTGTVQNYPQSVVGAVVYYSTTGLSLFSNYNQTCTGNCDSNHYLVCNSLTGLCQCPPNTFWNGTFCRNQLYPSSTCEQPYWCRQDLNLTCNFNTSVCECATMNIFHYYWNGTQCILCDYLTCQTQLYYEFTPPAPYNWTHHLHTYTAFNTIARLVFGFRNDLYWYWLDDVSVYDTQNSTLNLIQNGNFEQGNVDWNYSNPANAPYNGAITDQTASSDSTLHPYSGTWIYYDGATYAQDFLSQTFSTAVGHNYTISYYIMYENVATAEANVTIWP